MNTTAYPSNPTGRIKSLLLVLCFGFYLAIPGNAQNEISLSEALQTALANNFDIQIEEQRTEIARNNNNWAAAGRYPNISLQLGSTNRLSDVDNPASFLNGQFSNLGLNGTVNVAWNFFSGFRVAITKERLEELQRLSEGNASLVVENSLQAVILQYYQCQLQQQRLNVLQANLDLSRDRYAYLQTKKELGTGTTFDLLIVENAYFSDSSNLMLQEMNLRSSYRNLNQLLGNSPDAPVAVTGELPENFERYDQGLLRSKMFSNNRTLQNQFINLEILQKDVDLAEANKYPAISLNLGSTYGASRFQLENLEARSGSQLDYYANFSLNFTLYNGGAIKRGIENAMVNQRVAELGIESMELSMDYQLQDAYDLYQTRVALFELSDATLRTAQRNLEIAESKFRNGTINSFNYRDVQLNLLSGSLARAQALYNVLEAETALTRLIGGILDVVK